MLGEQVDVHTLRGEHVEAAVLEPADPADQVAGVRAAGARGALRGQPAGDEQLVAPAQLTEAGVSSTASSTSSAATAAADPDTGVGADALTGTMSSGCPVVDELDGSRALDGIGRAVTGSASHPPPTRARRPAGPAEVVTTVSITTR